MSYTRKVVFGFGIVLVCLTLANIFGYLLRLVLARALTPAEFGLVYAVMALFGFIGFAQTLGLSDALVQTLPSLPRQRVKSAFLTTIYAQLFVTTLIFIVALLLAPWLVTSYFHAPEAGLMMIIFGLVILVSPSEVSLMALFQGIGRPAWYGYMTLLRAVFLLLCTMLLLMLGLGVHAAILAYLFVYLLVPLVYLPVLLRILPEFRTSPARFDFALLRRLLRFGLPVLASSTVGLFLVYIDTFFITLYRTLPEVALYNVAMPTASLLWFVGTAIYGVMLSTTSDMHAKKKSAVLEDGIGRMYVYLLIVVLPFTALLVLFPDIIINALFGAEYLGAVLTMQLLAIGGVFNILNNLNTSVIVGLGKPGLTLRALVIAAAINVVGDIILIPRYGIAGSAVATLIAFLVLFVSNFVVLRSLVPFTIPYSRILRAVVATTVFSALIIVLRGALALPMWWKMGTSIAAAGAAYVLLLFAMRVVSIDEAQDLWRTVTRR